jgi:hypothetical protein
MIRSQRRARSRLGITSRKLVPQSRLTWRIKWKTSAAGFESRLPVGTYEGKTYLSPKTFEPMTTDHAGKGSGVERDFFQFPGDSFGMGLGLAVRTDPGNAKPPPRSLGELKWDAPAAAIW